MKTPVIYLLAAVIISGLVNHVSAQNSMVGDGFGGRLWYRPTNYTVGSYSAYSICPKDGCSNQLYGWGANNTGQLGLSTGIPGVNTPTPIPNMTDVKYYNTGYVMGAIKNDQTGWVWGNEFTTPTHLISDVKFVDASMTYVAFIKNDGTVWCVGSSSSGEFGTGTDYVNVTAPVQMTGISSAVRVACSATTTLILLADGTVKAVGSNNYGLLGIGDENLTHTLTLLDVPNLKNIVDIKANSIGALALDMDGHVYVWGSQNNEETKYEPYKLASLDNIIAISACADGFHCLALDAEGRCYGWGYSNLIGSPTNNTLDNLTVITDQVIDIMAGETFSYLVKSDGSL